MEDRRADNIMVNQALLNFFDREYKLPLVLVCLARRHSQSLHSQRGLCDNLFRWPIYGHRGLSATPVGGHYPRLIGATL